jgi:8-oxo-dGTP pyrophosphatase MutT (NUDIX family)
MPALIRKPPQEQVVYKIENGATFFLLVYSARNKEWGFPKGHIEEGETDKETARREIFEETGIQDLTFIDGLKVPIPI